MRGDPGLVGRPGGGGRCRRKAERVRGGRRRKPGKARGNGRGGPAPTRIVVSTNTPSGGARISGDAGLPPLVTKGPRGAVTAPVDVDPAAAVSSVEFRVLGPLEAVERAQPLRLGGPKQRAVLAMLLLHANEVVTADALVEAVWGEEPPTNARQTLQVYAANLRKVLNKNASDGAEHLSLRRGGYSVQARPDELD